MKRFGLALLAVMALVVAARPAMAQMASAGGLRYGVTAGLLMPMGDYGDIDKLGFVGGVGGTYWLSGGAIGVGADVSYSSTSHDGVDGKTKMLGGMASLHYAVTPARAPARVMITGGLGLYNVDIEATGVGSGSETKVGFGFGAAVAFKLGTGGTQLTLGSRYQSVSTDPSLNFLPITVGLSFGK